LISPTIKGICIDRRCHRWIVP